MGSGKEVWEEICWSLYGDPQDEPPGAQRFPVQNIWTLGAEYCGRMEDTGEALWHSREWERCLLGDSFTRERNYVSPLWYDDSEKSNELIRWYKPWCRGIYWDLSLLKSQLFFPSNLHTNSLWSVTKAEGNLRRLCRFPSAGFSF